MFTKSLGQPPRQSHTIRISDYVTSETQTASQRLYQAACLYVEWLLKTYGDDSQTADKGDDHAP